VIVLASRSPQRRALLASLGVPFRIVVSSAPEGADALENARAKARAAAARAGVPPGGAILGADTEVLLDGRALGKPADAAEARRMLRALAGRSHVVETAMVLLTAVGEREARGRTVVHVRPLCDAELDWYVATGEWRERAGGYAIQGAGAALIARIEGDHSTVVGLGLGALAAMLDAEGLAPWSRDTGDSDTQAGVP